MGKVRPRPSAPSASGWHDALRAVVPPFVITRAVLLVSTCLGLLWVQPFSGPGRWRTFPANLWLDGFTRWDSAWLGDVAFNGYQWHSSGYCNCAFLPAVPYLGRMLSLPLTGIWQPNQAFAIAVILMSYFGFFIGLFGMYFLAREKLTEAKTRLAIWLVCAFPFSYFFACAYTEGTFFALLTWSFWFARRQRWGWACLLVMLNCWVRVPGFFAAVAIGIEFLQAHGGRLRRDAAPLLMLVLGPLLLCGFYYVAVGRPLAFVTAQQGWRHGPIVVFFQILMIPRQQAIGISLFHTWCLGLLIGGLLACRPIARRYGGSWAVLVALSIIVPALSDLRIGRFCSVLFPLFVWVADTVEDRGAAWTIIAICGTFQLYFAYLFSHWYDLF